MARKREASRPPPEAPAQPPPPEAPAQQPPPKLSAADAAFLRKQRQVDPRPVPEPFDDG